MSPELIKELEAEMKAYGLTHDTPEEKEAAERAARLILLAAPRVRDDLVAEGAAQGARDGEARGMRTAVADLCEAYGVELTAERQAHLATLDGAGLTALRQHLKAHKAWPAGG
jgi:hypothetical protein